MSNGHVNESPDFSDFIESRITGLEFPSANEVCINIIDRNKVKFFLFLDNVTGFFATEVRMQNIIESVSVIKADADIKIIRESIEPIITGRLDGLVDKKYEFIIDSTINKIIENRNIVLEIIPIHGMYMTSIVDGYAVEKVRP